MSTLPKKERDLRIDFFRGLALIFIFVDHVPDNTWALATLRNFGFADASEVFVLLAGYSAGLAYWATEERGGFKATLERAVGRAREIYLWHIGVFVASALMLYLAARVFHNPAYVNNIAIAELAQAPLKTLAATLTLYYQPNQMNILPMYVVLMLWLPFVIAMLRQSVALAMVVSVSIWLIATVSGLNLPTHHREAGWFFNPFAWQLLFTTGAAVSVLVRNAETQARAEVLVPAVGYVVFAFLVAAPWVPISWLPDGRIIPQDVLGEMSKNDLSVWRFLHVLALAYLVAVLVPKNAAWLKASWAQTVQMCGRHSLEIFSLGTLLSFFGWIALTEFGSNQLTMLAVNVAGITLMGVTAWQMSLRKKSKGSTRPLPAGQPVAS